ncbi:MAG: hypothetical protein U9Q30_09610 [Campylobacterota bacterium]|nr:hypothetical protein [Campylobacterota bacterium]
MIDNTIEELMQLSQELYQDILLDINDVKKAKHDELLERNSKKLDIMEKLSLNKQKLNEELASEFHAGKDISIYKDSIDALESELRKLYKMNGKLAAIVLPVKEMYKDIIDDITRINGGALVEVMA